MSHSVKMTEFSRKLRELARKAVNTREDLEEWNAAARELEASIGRDRLTDRIPHFVWHYLADADIRLRDTDYRRDQEQQLEAVLGDLEDAQGVQQTVTSMKEAFQIELLDQGWLSSSDADGDLCSHGHLRLVIGGQEVIGGNVSYGISESALAMLRTLAADHTTEVPVAQQMVFHGCGSILMMGCPVGADFSVHHRNGNVTLGDAVRCDRTNEDPIRFSNLEVELPEIEYRDQVIGFALGARELFAGTVKRVEDGFEASQYREFWSEFNKILGNYGYAALSLAVRGPEQMRYENRNLIDDGPLVVRTVSGSVVDADGLPIASAGVGVFTATDHRLVTETVSNEQGEFEVLNLQQGLYRLVVKSPALCVANAKISVARWPRGGVLGASRLRVSLIVFRADARSWIEYR